MKNQIPVPPVSLNWPPLGERWYRWSEVEACFWPGPGKRSDRIDPELARTKDLGGVYLLAWSQGEPARIRPQTAERVKYIGETNWFKGRMTGFALSAGFWGQRSAGHSAGWRWEEGKTQELWLAFFEIGLEYEAHLASGLRRWMEGVALEEYRIANHKLPALNAARRNTVICLDE